MVTRLVPFVLSLLVFAHASQAQTIGDLINAINNATAALRAIETDAHNATELAAEYYQFLSTHWPLVEQHLAELSRLPAAIESAAHTVSILLPALETSIYFFGGSLILYTVVSSIWKIAEYCQRRLAAQHAYNAVN